MSDARKPCPHGHLPRSCELCDLIEQRDEAEAKLAHLRVMAEFALLTGLRQRNVSFLEWSQVDLARGVLWIHADQAKARRSLGIPLSTPARDLLGKQRGQHEQWVFPYRGQPVRKIKSAWRKALGRAGLEGVTWHTLRHTWASWHAMSGTPVPVLRELGGWSTLSMVSRYTHLSPEHLKRYAGNVARFSGHRRRPQRAAKR